MVIVAYAYGTIDFLTENVNQMKKLLYIIPGLLLLLSSCSNKDIEFNDYDFQAVYFAYQYPVRTITFGEDFVDTSMDNEGKFQIMATLGGVYSNKKDVTLSVAVDTSLTTGFQFSGGDDILPLPETYYELAGYEIVIPKGKIAGGVEVQLTEAFFNDPLAIDVNYVLPLVITDVQNADSILVGRANDFVPSPRRLAVDDWDIQPKDYVLYALRYVNEWHGTYLRRGKDDIIMKDGFSEPDTLLSRSNQYVEDDQVVSLSTVSRNSVVFPFSLSGDKIYTTNAELILTFDEEGGCSISTSDTGVSVSGSGKYVKLGEKKSFGNKDRDALYLDYVVETDAMTVSVKDTLVFRNKGVQMELFSVTELEE